MKVQTATVTAQRIASAPEHYRGMINGEARFAVVRGAHSVKQVLAYLPDNYALMESFETERHMGWDGVSNPIVRKELVIIIGGYDSAGWTLDGYVIPRLASGLYACEEIPT